ncbi:DNA repair protein RecO [Fulvitalea axinellae]|uniref:DNA repair protein RecO n=1 Tax=Fulvitalea axinellae TaxID=1182444 RepID=A0AAU9CJ28_9BACT|nr:DNA repair protein RecO [Fulvitalea axinellae]
MLHPTKGIVLNFIKFKESSIIVRIYTDAFGLQSYIVNGVRSKRSKGKIALFQPLTLLDMVVYKKNNSDIQRISEYRCAEPYHTLPFDIAKSGIAMFLTECLARCIREEKEQHDLFEFLYHSFLTLDHLEGSIANFHLQFLLKFGRYLGFALRSTDDLLTQTEVYLKTDTLSPQNRQNVEKLINSGYGDPVPMNVESRRKILDLILKFYQLHVENFGELKSLQVLETVLHR